MLAFYLAVSGTACSAEDNIIATVMKIDAIKFRIAKSHSISGSEQKPEGDAEPTVHVYMTLSEHAYPYVISLGNFVVLKTKDGETKILDEFGERIPMPNRQPERVGFHKGDLLALKAFDLAAEGKYVAALKTNDAALKYAPNSYRLHNNQGVFLTLVNRHEEALKELAEAIKLNPNCAAAYANRAWRSIATSKPALAAEDAQAALKVEPKLNSARLCLVKSNLDEGKKEDAQKLIEDTGLAGRNDAASLRLQAETFIANKDYKAARATLRKLILLTPNDANVVLQLAYVSDMEGDLDEAIGRARQAVTMAPDSPGVREILGRYLEKNRDDQAASLQYESALDVLNDVAPKDRMKKALNIEGALLRTCMRLNDFKRAETWTSYFTKQFPASASAHYNRAWLLAQGGEDYYIKEALAEYDTALKLDPGLKQTHYNLALLSIKTGDKKRAESELKLFLELAPDDPDHESAKSLLAKLQAESKP